ncbi:hypothetical protein F4821DRAFT_281390 [Hypoxylon rubiginosum]|uniref:Uncharacterized protein n=1 Tax=Hypoxylon rubiginosum TaxID=110542 RepID=A0ACC0CRN6_9PEZI|nr:hypothetical protein F4821DRAFT_281390 [Hypoxylon rubiginosum]
MVAIQKIFLATLSMTAVHAVEITNQCPSNQSLVGNSKCCPGYAIQDNGSFCCVKDPDWKCDNVLTCFDGNCNAKVSIDDPDYDQKVSAASGTSSSSASTSPSLATSTASISVSRPSASSDSASGTSTTTTGSTTASSGTAAATHTGNAATEARKATLGMVAALAAAPVAFYAL